MAFPQSGFDVAPGRVSPWTGDAGVGGGFGTAFWGRRVRRGGVGGGFGIRTQFLGFGLWFGGGVRFMGGAACGLEAFELVAGTVVGALVDLDAAIQVGEGFGAQVV